MSPTPISRETSGTPEAGAPYYPPRASPGMLRARRFLSPLQLAVRRAGTAASGLFPAALRGDAETAALLSLFPGLGHLYAEGRPVKAAVFFAVFAVFATWYFLYRPVTGSTLLFWALFGYHNWLMTDSHARARTAAGLPRSSVRAAILISLVCAALLGLSYFAAGSLVRSSGYGLITVATDTLAPSFKTGDRLMIRRQDSYKRGETVFSQRTRSFGRVLALPGETIGIKEGKIFINDAPLDKSFYPLTPDAAGSKTLNGAVAVVPGGSYCVMFPAEELYAWRDLQVYKNAVLRRFFFRTDEISGKVILRYSPEVEAFQ